MLTSPPQEQAPTAPFGPPELQMIPQKLPPGGAALPANVWANPEATMQQYIDVPVEHIMYPPKPP
jgi:hypothetical protein